MNSQEMEFYNLVTDLFLKIRPDCPPGFLLQMPQRQVASCIPAAKQYLKDIARTGQIEYSGEDIDEDELNEPVSNLSFSREDIVEVNKVIEYGEQIAEPDSKTKEFIREIKDILTNVDITKVLIFSFFKRTLKYLEKILISEGYSVVRIDGDVPFIERERLMGQFSKQDGYQILLSSEVGGEGLDFQFCNCMINYDLPWNPMRVEQRIGRLDRYGQMSKKILIYNFSVEGTIESDIFLRLCNRIGVFEQYIGELEPIIGDTIKQLSNEICTTKLTPEQLKLKADQAAMVIERKKQELEIFDVERKKLIGQDAYFSEQVSEIMKKERFITPVEVWNFVDGFIKEKFARSKIVKVKGYDGVYTISADEKFKEFINDYFRKNRSNNETIEQLNELLNQDSFEVTFDSKTANSHPRMEFITMRHVIVKAIIDYYKNIEFKKVTKIQYFDKEAVSEKEYIFFIYLLDVQGFTKSLTFIPIVYDCETKAIAEKCSANLFEIIKNSSDYNLEIPLDESMINFYEQQSLEYMIDHQNHIERELSLTNESLINDRIDSLKQTFERQLNWIDDIIRKAEDKS